MTPTHLSMSHEGKEILRQIVEGLVDVAPGPWEADQSVSRRYLDVVNFRLKSGSTSTVAMVGADEAVVGASEVEEQNATSAHIARCHPDAIRAIAEYVSSLEAELSTARRTALLEAAEIADSCFAEHEARAIAAAIRKLAEEA